MSSAALKQRTLDGRITSPPDLNRVLIKVSRSSQRRLQHGAAVRPFSMIEIAEVAVKLAIVVLNRLPNEQIETILSSDDQDEIAKTLSNLSI